MSMEFEGYVRDEEVLRGIEGIREIIGRGINSYDNTTRSRFDSRYGSRTIFDSSPITSNNHHHLQTIQEYYFLDLIFL